MLAYIHKILNIDTHRFYFLPYCDLIFTSLIPPAPLQPCFTLSPSISYISGTNHVHSAIIMLRLTHAAV